MAARNWRKSRKWTSASVRYNSVFCFLITLNSSGFTAEISELKTSSTVEETRFTILFKVQAHYGKYKRS